jgi:CO/xanthine dehydrogenase FAD-binding subunit
VNFVSASTLAEATQKLGDNPLRVLAGGTDLAVEYRRTLPQWTGLLHVGRVPELQQIDLTAQAITIGAAVTYARIARIACDDPGLAVVRDAATTIGSPGIMNCGTLGGNLATASPAGDGSLALLTLDTTVNVARKGGTRGISIDQFFVAPRKSVLQPDELVVSISFARSAPGRRGTAFRKIGNRDASILSVAAVAIALDVDDAGLCRSARVAFGAVAPTPRRSRAVEAEIVGKKLDALPALDLDALIQMDVAPIDDQRSTSWYRREILPVLLREAIDDATRRIEKDALRG